MHDLNFWFSCIMLGFQFSLSRQKRQQVSRCFASPYERLLQELLCHQDCSPHLIKKFPRPVLLFVIIYTFIVHFLNNSFIVCKQMHMDLYIVHMRYLHHRPNTAKTEVCISYLGYAPCKSRGMIFKTPDCQLDKELEITTEY